RSTRGMRFDAVRPYPRLGPQARGGASPAAMREEPADAASRGIAREAAQPGEEGACDERGVLGRQAIVVEELRREPSVAERVAGAVGDGAHGQEGDTVPGSDTRYGGGLHVLDFLVRRDGRTRRDARARRRRPGQLAVEYLTAPGDAGERLPSERVAGLPPMAEDDQRIVRQAHRRAIGRRRWNAGAPLELRRQGLRGPPCELDQR